MTTASPAGQANAESKRAGSGSESLFSVNRLFHHASKSDSDGINTGGGVSYIYVVSGSDVTLFSLIINKYTRKGWCPRTGKGQRLMGILAVTGYGSV